MDMLVARKVSISLESVLFERLLNHFRLCETRQALSQNASPATLIHMRRTIPDHSGFFFCSHPPSPKKKSSCGAEIMQVLISSLSGVMPLLDCIHLHGMEGWNRNLLEEAPK